MATTNPSYRDHSGHLSPGTDGCECRWADSMLEEVRAIRSLIERVHGAQTAGGRGGHMSGTAADDDDLITASEVQRLLKYRSLDAVYQARRRGRLPFLRLGKRLLFSRKEVLAQAVRR